MNKLAITLTLSAISIVALAPAASAQEGVSASVNRFNFGKSNYKQDPDSMPRSFGAQQPTTTVRSGAVTHGLPGVDAAFLKPPVVVVAPRVAPIVQTHITPQASFGNPVPTLVTHVPNAFKAAFGAPLSVPAASKPPTTARIAPAKSHAAPARPVSASRSVSAKMSTPKLPAGRAAAPVAPIASYGNQGYSQGAYLPTGSGHSSNTDVHAKIVHH